VTDQRAEVLLLDLPKGRLEVRLAGEGPPLVLIPSLGRGQEDFDEVTPALLEAGLRVIQPEPRGIGASAPLAPGATLHDMAGDIAEVIAHLGCGPVVVAGHAAGNFVARMLARDRPDLVAAVVMMAAVTGTSVDPAIASSIDGSADTSLPEEVRLAHLQRGYFAPGHDARVWLSGWHTDVARAQRAARVATTDRAWLRVGEHKPLLYIGAALDVISPPPDEAELRARLGAQARLLVIPEAGHALLPEQPASVARALIAYVREILGPIPA
jgi:pimeloyl-ACP methyl ester carboxylesterase